MQSIQRVEPISAMKVFAVLYAVIGLVAGVFVSLLAMAGMMTQASQDLPAGFGFIFGAAAIIVLPICYAVVGAIGGLILAAIYNAVAKYTGGIQIQLG